MVQKPLGFGDVRQTAQFFGLTQAEVKTRAHAGNWPSYVIGGRRVFDLDELVESLARGTAPAAEAAAQ